MTFVLPFYHTGIPCDRNDLEMGHFKVIFIDYKFDINQLPGS